MCPECTSVVGWSGDGHGPHPIGSTERIPGGIGWRLIERAVALCNHGRLVASTTCEGCDECRAAYLAQTSHLASIALEPSL